MLVFVQFTLADLRALSNKRSMLLVKPTWPSPTPYKEFVRGIGPIVQRKSKGLNSWVGENFICEVRNDFAFKKYYKITRQNIIIKNLYKHLYSGGFYFPTKYEFVFSIKRYKGKIDYEYLIEILGELLSVKLLAKSIHGRKEIMFKSISRELLKSHLYSTSYSNFLDGSELSHLINTCTPQIFIQLEEGEYVNVKGRKLRLVSDSDDYDLFTFWYNSLNNPYVVWLFNRVNKEYKDARTIRMSILRLHSEYECFRKLVHSFNQGSFDIKKNSQESEILQDYFNRATQTFLREERIAEGYSAGNFMDDFSRIYSNFQPGELLLLKNKITELNFRRQVQEKTNILFQKIEKMENNFNVNNSPGAAVGFGNTANNQGAIQLVTTLPTDYNYSALVEQLDKLKAELKTKADTTEELEALSNVSKARDAAENKDSSKILEYLKLGGHWVFETASRIGAHMIAALIMHPPA